LVGVAIEVGGTFTDLIWLDGAGEIRTHKVPSTPDDPARAVIAGLEEALEGQVERVRTLFHGSTVATNAVIERRGCRAALLTTWGFRDLLAIQRQLRPNVYSLACLKPEPLIPLERVLEVPERIGPDGTVLEPLDVEALLVALDDLMARQRPQSIAVCLLHSYRNPAHERQVAELLRERHPDIPVILSSAVLPTFREYERASTTAMAAYLAPLVGRYLRTIGERLEAAGGRLFVMQSSGGILPAAGLGERGTSADVCLIAGGQPEVRAETVVAGLPVGMPTVDIANVGAGGGSITWLDRGGMLQVGPQSAGAFPGPACYGRGGEAPTVTDALVQLGWIRPQAFLGGRMPLQAAAAEQALATLGGDLGLDAAGTAEAIVAIGTANVSRGVRLVSVQRGHDPKRHALYAYGGMGPMIAALAAEELGIRRIVVPPHPGLFSALGLLVADHKRIYLETAFLPVGPAAAGTVAETFLRLQRTAEAEFAEYGLERAALVFEWILEMRYVGQGFELQVPVAPERLEAEGSGYLLDSFRAVHETSYGNAPPSEEIEIVTFRLVARKPSSGDALERLEAEVQETPQVEAGRIRHRGQLHDCSFVRRGSLPRGFEVEGCAIVEEPTSTTFVPPGWRARVGPLGALEITREEAA
jgi:N-methylhydantoinase A